MGYWWLLIVAGVLETAWAVGLKYSDGFSRFWPSVGTTIAIFASMFLLSLAARGIPIGTAYSVWVGIGALGAVLLGMLLFGEPVTVPRLLCVLLLVAAIAGLKLTSTPPPTTPHQRNALNGRRCCNTSPPFSCGLAGGPPGPTAPSRFGSCRN